MKKMPRPFFVKARQTWYVQIGGKQINLGKEEAAAWKEYHRIMAEAGNAPMDNDPEVSSLLERYLAWVQNNRSKSYYEGQQRWCSRWYAFLLAKPAYRNLTVSKTKAHHVLEWLDDPKQWPKPITPDTRNTIIRCLKRVFNWACDDMGYIDHNPIDKLKLGPTYPRETVANEDHWELIFQFAKVEGIRDFFTLLRETGCRPFEVQIVEKKHWHREQARWIFERTDSKGKKYPRTVELTETAQEITAKWALRNPEGPLLRNSQGRPWTRSSINCFLKQIKKKHPTFNFFPYAARHAFATDGLVNGVDSVVIGNLMGHRNPTMVAKVYGHIAQKKDAMKSALAKVHGRATIPLDETKKATGT